MKRLFYILILFLIGNNTINGQNKLSNAIYHLKQMELDKAKELIDAAVEDTLFSGKANTWYYRGAIYKELFKRDQTSNKNSPYRKTAVESFYQCLNREKNGTVTESAKKSLNYLAQTIYNHSATSFDENNYQNAIDLYDRYKEITAFIKPETEFKDKDIMFKLALATTFGRIAENDTTKKEAFLDKAKELYKQVIGLDSNNISANYNLGILYYNEGVEIVNNMDYSLDLIELNAVQDQIVELFRKSLPFMLKAYELNPKRRETLIGLQGIYFSLNDMKKSEEYKRQLEALEENGAADDQPGNGKPKKEEKDSQERAK